MSKQSNRLREQALQAERLSYTISDVRASRTLRAIAKQYHAQADALEQVELPPNQSVQTTTTLQNATANGSAGGQGRRGGPWKSRATR